MKSKFLASIKQAITANTFIKITLSKKSNKKSDLNNLYIRWIEIKGEMHFSFTFRHTTKDVVKNFLLTDGLLQIEDFLGNTFLNGQLFTLENDIKIVYNKKRIPKILRSKPTLKELPALAHDKQKHRFIEPDAPFLQELGISNQKGEVFKNRQAKFKQINKYIEVIDNIISPIVQACDAISGARPGGGSTTIPMGPRCPARRLCRQVTPPVRRTSPAGGSTMS